VQEEARLLALAEGRACERAADLAAAAAAAADEQTSMAGRLAAASASVRSPCCRLQFVC
jgi:hypothetical protein